MTAALVVQTARLGDVVLTPLPLAALAARGPVDAVATPGVALDCRPCPPHGVARCPLRHHSCLRTLDVAAVGAAVRQTLVEEATCV